MADGQNLRLNLLHVDSKDVTMIQRLDIKQWVITLLLVSCTSSPNAGTVERATAKLVSHLNAGEIAKAAQEFSRTILTKVSEEELVANLKIVSEDAAIRNYLKLQVCEWAVNLVQDDEFITGQGLLEHGKGKVRFATSLHKDSDNVWRIVGFH